MAGLCTSWCWFVAHTAVHWVAFPLLLQVGDALCYSNSHLINMVEHITFRTQQDHLMPLPSLHGKEGSSFQGLVPSDDMINSESMVAIQPGNSNNSYCVSAWWIYSHLVDRTFCCSGTNLIQIHGQGVNFLACFLLKLAHENFTVLDQAVKEFQHGLESPLGFHQNSRIRYTPWKGWCHHFFSLFRVPILS